MKKIAVIGANGQLGSDIYLCLKEDYNVIPLLHEDIEIIQQDSVVSCLNKRDFYPIRPVIYASVNSSLGFVNISVVSLNSIKSPNQKSPVLSDTRAACCILCVTMTMV